MRNVILNNEWCVQPPDIQINGNCNYEVGYLNNMSKAQNVYCKKSSELMVTNDVKPNLMAIGRPDKAVPSMLAESIKRKSSLFNS